MTKAKNGLEIDLADASLTTDCDGTDIGCQTKIND